MKLISSIQLRLLSKEKHLEKLQGVLEGAPKYSMNVSGNPQSSSAAEETFDAIPDGFDVKRKFLFGIFQDDYLIGCIDLLRGFPNDESAMLGLLLIVEKNQGQGIGRIAYTQLLDFMSSWPEINKVRIGVVKNNGEVLSFWKKKGFKETGVCRPYKNGTVISESVILEMIR